MSTGKGCVNFRVKRLCLIAIVLFFFFMKIGMCMGKGTTVIYVDVDARGENNGKNWANAFNGLDVALASIDASGLNWEVWVAEGNYRPAYDGDRNKSFNLKRGVALYGGFTGTERAREDRNVLKNETILTGNIGDPVKFDDNSYHVIYSDNVDDSAVLDGFIVIEGNARNSWPNSCGSGMFNDESSPRVANCLFRGNISTHGAGGGMYNLGGEPTVTNCVFTGNKAPTGGALFNDRSAATIINCTFTKNSSSDSGGGIYNAPNSNPRVINCILWDNTGGEITDYGSTFLLSYCVVKNGYSDKNSAFNIINKDPCLISLDSNAGSVRAFRLGIDSSAIDSGLSSDEIPLRDQRGVSRPQGVGCDIGACEAEFFTFAMATGGSGSGKVSPDYGVYSCFEKTDLLLSADADTGSTFVGWSGDISGTENPVSLTLSRDIRVVAVFRSDVAISSPFLNASLFVPDKSDLLNDLIDGTITLDLPENMTLLSFDIFRSADIDPMSKAEYIAYDDVPADLRGTFITGISFDIAARVSPDGGKTGILPLDVTFEISRDRLSTGTFDIENILNEIKMCKIMGTKIHNLMDIVRENGLPLDDFFSVTEDKYGCFNVTLGLLVVDAQAGDMPSVQPLVAGGDCRFFIFDGETDERFKDPLVALKNSHNLDRSNGGCSAPVLFPSMVLLLVPLIVVLNRR